MMTILLLLLLLSHTEEEEYLAQSIDHCVGAHPLLGALGWRGLNPIKSALPPMLVGWLVLV